MQASRCHQRCKGATKVPLMTTSHHDRKNPGCEVVIGGTHADGEYCEATVFNSLRDFIETNTSFEVLAVDIPIGLPEGTACRGCDYAAREYLKPNTSSVFITPPRCILAAPTYQEANEISWRKYNRGVSAQAFALGARILEVEPVAANDNRLVETHPEACFREMKNRPLAYTKKSWNGQMERRRLLQRHGIRVPNYLRQAGGVPPDDLLDAAAAAWTAWRVANGEAKVLPDSAAGCARSRRGVIWY